jgi:hypothetical protein
LSDEINLDLFHPFERLIRIDILGHSVEVPEKNPILRCFQYISLNTISFGDFCWNGDCANCQIWYRGPGDDASKERPALSCRTTVIEGMSIVRLADYLKLEGITSPRENKTTEEQPT